MKIMVLRERVRRWPRVSAPGSALRRPARAHAGPHPGRRADQDGSLGQQASVAGGRLPRCPVGVVGHHRNLGGSVRHAIVLVEHVTCGRRAWGIRSGWLPGSQRGRPA
jgi:hypothetical protein